MGKLVGAVWCWWYRQIAGNSILHKNQTGCDKIKPGKGVQHFIFFWNSDCEAKNWRWETERGRWLILLFCWIELVRNKNRLCQVFFSHALQVEKKHHNLWHVILLFNRTHQTHFITGKRWKLWAGTALTQLENNEKERQWTIRSCHLGKNFFFVELWAFKLVSSNISPGFLKDFQSVL